MALKLLSSAIPKVTDKTFSKKYIALGRIVTHWEDIIGNELKQKAQPIKIHYRKSKDKKAPPNATLEIAVSSADAALLHYQKDVILMRINQIFGDAWITDIKFKHFTPDIKEKSVPTRKKVLDQTEEKNLSDMLENIEDSDIKSRLMQFGQSFLKDKG